ncbi:MULTISPECIES: replication-relaxation family protein [unclassified Chryseobacterium]|uniref:replication-relaxation family protein n=1 Tax=unclassified Chryseobacterium TaxID=2593645 RepID=UPI000D342759|nr:MULTISPECIES: replication-relaxation family protein [unclassified Chryseobacterium]PTT72604.1 hypothetical protein DBR25_14375 [Chryseobacterium sp. HMWF001]PVV50425.1 hypothetical protein DD829_22435 [Chryseobacterium sp. HMWF035]
MKTKETLTPSMEKILVNLSIFKYLTTSQLIRLKVMKDRRNLNRALACLRQMPKPLVQSLSFAVHPTEGKLEHIHHLTSFGAELLKEYYGGRFTVRYPKGNSPMYGFDYFHRLGVVNFEIELRIFAGKNDLGVSFFTTYFDKVSTGKEKGYRAASAIVTEDHEYLIADALFMLEGPRRDELYALEVYMDNNTARIMKSITRHQQVLEKGRPSKQFGLKHGSRVLCVFKHKKVQLKVMEKISQDYQFSETKKHFLFKSLDELETEKFFDWQFYDGTEASLF